MVKICLDAGHYGAYNRSPAVPDYYESRMNWKLHLLLKAALEAYGFSVVTTRPDPELDLPLESRGKASAGCDLFLSLHSNAAGSGVYEDVDYVVAYVMLDGSTDALGKALSQEVARVMATRQSPQVKTRQGSRGEYYGVLRGAAAVGTPGIILEHSFHTQTRATKWLMEEENLKALAEAEAQVIARHFGLEKPEEKPEEKPIYRVQTGAFTQLKNAQNQVLALQKAGFEAIIKVG